MGSELSKTKSDLSLELSLQSFFFDQLTAINQKTSPPLPKEAIFYSSLVLDQFGTSENLFEEVEGKKREKILGLKLLESSNLPKGEQRRSLKDIGDTALFVCGFFSDAVNNKIVDLNYYHNIGKTAYNRLHGHFPEAYDVESFYKLLSKWFERMSTIIGLVAQETFNKSKENNPYILMLNNEIKVS